MGRRDAASEYVSVAAQIEERKLMYPVTAINGQLVYDRAVSFPFIMRSIEALTSTPA